MVKVDRKTSLYWPKKGKRNVFEHDCGSGKATFVVRVRFLHNNILRNFFFFEELCRKLLNSSADWLMKVELDPSITIWCGHYWYIYTIDRLILCKPKWFFFFVQFIRSTKTFQKHLKGLTFPTHVPCLHTINSIIFWNEFIEVCIIYSWRKKTTTEISNLFWLL